MLLNIIEPTESSQQCSESRTGSRGANSSFNVERDYSVHANSIDGQLYQEGFGQGCFGVATVRDRNDSNINFSELNRKNQVTTHSESLQSMRQCGLLSKYAIR